MKPIKTYCPKNRQDWRRWLQRNHIKEDAVWLLYHKKTSAAQNLVWAEAVEEALCFGWIDSKRQAVDALTFRQFFGKRKPSSTWSTINKARVANLIEKGLVAPAGLEAIELAKQNGSWTILDEVEKQTIPPDLEKVLKRVKNASKNFAALSKSNRRILLQWLVMAKRPETRQKRISEIASAVGKNRMPKPFLVVR